MSEEELSKDVPNYIFNNQFLWKWVKYKGEIFWATLNYERSIKAGCCMIDLSWCITKEMNGIIIKTVAFNKNKFELSEHGN